MGNSGSFVLMPTKTKPDLINFDFKNSSKNLRAQNLSTIQNDPYANDFGLPNPTRDRSTSNSQKSHYIGLKNRHQRHSSLSISNNNEG